MEKRSESVGYLPSSVPTNTRGIFLLQLSAFSDCQQNAWMVLFVPEDELDLFEMVANSLTCRGIEMLKKGPELDFLSSSIL